LTSLEGSRDAQAKRIGKVGSAQGRTRNCILATERVSERPKRRSVAPCWFEISIRVWRGARRPTSENSAGAQSSNCDWRASSLVAESVLGLRHIE
jgi:hypothetical protein